MKFVKKPVIIDAWSVSDLIRRYEDRGAEGLPEPIAAAYEDGRIDFPSGLIGSPPSRIDVITLEGIMQANHGWWIIKGVQGELYPCKGSIFKDTYTAVDYEPRLVSGE